MDITTDNINTNKTTSLEESNKIEAKNTKNYDTFQDSKHENDEDTEMMAGLNKTKDNEATLLSREENLYFKIMNGQNSKYHVLASFIYFLSLISFEFLIIQVAVMFRIILNVNKLEQIVFLSLIFCSISFGWILKNIFLVDFYRRNSILISAFIICLIILLIVISKSAYILFLGYPFISFLTALILFNSSQLFEDYYKFDYSLCNNTLLKKNILISLSMTGSLLVFFIMWVFSKETFSLWYYELSIFGVIILTIGTLTYFANESPISLLKNEKGDPTLLLNLLEEISQKKFQINKEQVVAEVRTIIKQKSLFNYISLFKLKADYKFKTGVFIIVILCTAFVNTSLIMSIPRNINTNIPIQVIDRMGFFLFRVFIVLIISCIGGFLGTLLIYLLSFKNKFKIMIVSLFLTQVSLLILIIIFNNLLYIFGGFCLLLGNAIVIILINYASETYEPYLNEKGVKAYHFTYYTSAAFAMIIFESLYSITPISGFITTTVFAYTGAVFAFFL